LTVRELIEHKRDTIRARRRATFYQLPVCKSCGGFYLNDETRRLDIVFS
jgi:hypothetical protein